MGRDKKNVHRHTKAGLCIPVHLVREKIKKRLSKFLFNKDVDVLFVSYVEPIVLDLLETSAEFTKQSKLKRMSVRDVAKALGQRKDSLLPATIAGEFVAKKE